MTWRLGRSLSSRRVAAVTVALVGLLATVPFAFQGSRMGDTATAMTTTQPAQAGAALQSGGGRDAAPAGGTPAAAPTAVGRAPGASAAQSTPSTLDGGDGRFLAAEALVDRLEVFDVASGTSPMLTLANPNPAGARLMLAAISGREGWLQVQLPVRPNGSTGWVRLADVAVVRHAFRIEVRLAERQLIVYNGDEVIQIEPIGVGRQPTPTPGGSFYLYELLRPDDPSGPYGPLAFGLSGFSEALDSFNGGDGRLGIHGTDDPLSLGADSTSGCIRLANPAIEQLARTVPLGTPVVILT